MTDPVVPVDAQAQTDPWIVRAVVVILGTVAVIGMLTMGWIIHEGLPVVLADPDKAASLIAILAVVGTPTSAALAAVGAVLVSTRSRG